MKSLRGGVVRTLLALLAALPLASGATMVRLQTPLGPIDIELLDTQTPLTVANFLNYVRKKAYDGTIVHRSVPGFVIQSGGYAVPTLAHIATDAAVKNEFSATRSNVRGTVAMAKIGGNPDSATSEWFVNLADNSANLDGQNGGFTVFGHVTTPGMAVADAIAALQRVNASGCASGFGAFDNLPVTSGISSCAQITSDVLVVVTAARELPARDTDTPSDRIFNYLEANYPQYAAPASPASGTALGYYYRYYSKTNAYAGTKDGNVYYLLPENNGTPQLLGSIATWLGIAAAAGY